MAASVALMAQACAGADPVDPPQELRSSTDRLALTTSYGMERAIPLRIVMMARDCTVAPLDWSCGWRSPPANSCTPCTDGAQNCGVDTADFVDIRRGVDMANIALRTLGVQVFVSSIEKYAMPLFWNVTTNNDVQWNDGLLGGDDDKLRNQLRLAYPLLLNSAFENLDHLSENKWLHATSVRAGDPREIIVWLAECSNGWDGTRPWGGAADLIADRDIFTQPLGLAHEIGHILGLEHTMNPHNATNPELQGDYGLGDAATGPIDESSDYWDLLYTLNGGQPQYYTSRATVPVGQTLYWKHSGFGASQNCWLDQNCTLSCCINGTLNQSTYTCTSGQLQTIGDPGIAGLGFTYPGDNPGAGVYRRGANAMFYIWVPSQCQKRASFSESQAEQVKRLLRADIRVDDVSILAEQARGYTANRDHLGDWRGRWGFDQVDFDLDGKRDIVTWNGPTDAGGACGDGVCSTSENAVSCGLDCVRKCTWDGPGIQCGDTICQCPESSATCPKDCGGPDPCGNGVCGLSESSVTCPGDCPSACGNGFCGSGETSTCPKDCGTFRALLSSSGYTTTLERNLGRAGDEPVLADFDGDGRTDFGIARSGGLTTENRSDNAVWWIWCRSSANWSCAQTVCAWPNECVQWGARGDVLLPGNQLNTNAAHELAIYRPSNKYVYWISVDQSGSGSFYTRFESPIVHLPGLYDNDSKTDFVTYNPNNARFAMLLSTVGWNYTQDVARYFDAALRSDAVGASGAGASAGAMRHGGVPLPAEWSGKRVLRVWDAYTGTWHTNWDPINSTTISTCTWGAPRDIPLAGPIDRDANSKTDLVVFRPTQNPPTVYVKGGNLCLPGSNEYSFTVAGGTPRSLISAVRDMSGDARGDVLVFDPSTAGWTRYYSQSFAAQSVITFGDDGAMPL